MNHEQMLFATKLKARLLANPKKVWMNYFRVDMSDAMEMDSLWRTRRPELLACGTVECIAGTACSMAGVVYGPDIKLEEEATRLLGLSHEQANDLFFFPFNMAPLYEWHRERIGNTEPGTREYVAAVADALQTAIDEFYKKEAA